ncbi:hypothetical protein X975_01894, partial [Stegodyphus mimosarum]
MDWSIQLCLTFILMFYNCPFIHSRGIQTNPFANHDTATAFVHSFVRYVSSSEAFGNQGNEDFEEILETLLTAMQQSTYNKKESSARIKTMTMAFASSIAELIVVEDSQEDELDIKTKIITDALEYAFSEVMGNVDIHFIEEIKILVKIFAEEQVQDIDDTFTKQSRHYEGESTINTNKQQRDETRKGQAHSNADTDNMKTRFQPQYSGQWQTKSSPQYGPDGIGRKQSPDSDAGATKPPNSEAKAIVPLKALDKLSQLYPDTESEGTGDGSPSGSPKSPTGPGAPEHSGSSDGEPTNSDKGGKQPDDASSSPRHGSDGKIPDKDTSALLLVDIDIATLLPSSQPGEGPSDDSLGGSEGPTGPDNASPSQPSSAAPSGELPDSATIQSLYDLLSKLPISLPDQGAPSDQNKGPSGQDAGTPESGMSPEDKGPYGGSDGESPESGDQSDTLSKEPELVSLISNLLDDIPSEDKPKHSAPSQSESSPQHGPKHAADGIGKKQIPDSDAGSPKSPDSKAKEIAPLLALEMLSQLYPDTESEGTGDGSPSGSPKSPTGPGDPEHSGSSDGEPTNSDEGGKQPDDASSSPGHRTMVNTSALLLEDIDIATLLPSSQHGEGPSDDSLGGSESPTGPDNASSSQPSSAAPSGELPDSATIQSLYDLLSKLPIPLPDRGAPNDKNRGPSGQDAGTPEGGMSPEDKGPYGGSDGESPESGDQIDTLSKEPELVSLISNLLDDIPSEDKPKHSAPSQSESSPQHGPKHAADGIGKKQSPDSDAGSPKSPDSEAKEIAPLLALEKLSQLYPDTESEGTGDGSPSGFPKSPTGPGAPEHSGYSDGEPTNSDEGGKQPDDASSSPGHGSDGKIPDKDTSALLLVDIDIATLLPSSQHGEGPSDDSLGGSESPTGPDNASSSQPSSAAPSGELPDSATIQSLYDLLSKLPIPLPDQGAPNDQNRGPSGQDAGTPESGMSPEDKGPYGGSDGESPESGDQIDTLSKEPELVSLISNLLDDIPSEDKPKHSAPSQSESSPQHGPKHAADGIGKKQIPDSDAGSPKSPDSKAKEIAPLLALEMLSQLYPDTESEGTGDGSPSGSPKSPTGPGDPEHSGSSDGEPTNSDEGGKQPDDASSSPGHRSDGKIPDKDTSALLLVDIDIATLLPSSQPGEGPSDDSLGGSESPTGPENASLFQPSSAAPSGQLPDSATIQSLYDLLSKLPIPLPDQGAPNDQNRGPSGQDAGTPESGMSPEDKAPYGGSDGESPESGDQIDTLSKEPELVSLISNLLDDIPSEDKPKHSAPSQSESSPQHGPKHAADGIGKKQSPDSDAGSPKSPDSEAKEIAPLLALEKFSQLYPDTESEGTGDGSPSGSPKSPTGPGAPEHSGSSDGEPTNSDEGGKQPDDASSSPGHGSDGKIPDKDTSALLLVDIDIATLLPSSQPGEGPSDDSLGGSESPTGPDNASPSQPSSAAPSGELPDSATIQSLYDLLSKLPIPLPDQGAPNDQNRGPSGQDAGTPESGMSPEDKAPYGGSDGESPESGDQIDTLSKEPELVSLISNLLDDIPSEDKPKHSAPSQSESSPQRGPKHAADGIGKKQSPDSDAGSPKSPDSEAKEIAPLLALEKLSQLYPDTESEGTGDGSPSGFPKSPTGPGAPEHSGYSDGEPTNSDEGGKQPDDASSSPGHGSDGKIPDKDTSALLLVDIDIATLLPSSQPGEGPSDDSLGGSEGPTGPDNASPSQPSSAAPSGELPDSATIQSLYDLLSKLPISLPDQGAPSDQNKGPSGQDAGTPESGMSPEDKGPYGSPSEKHPEFISKFAQAALISKISKSRISELMKIINMSVDSKEFYFNVDLFFGGFKILYDKLLLENNNETSCHKSIIILLESVVSLIQYIKYSNTVISPPIPINSEILLF